MKNSLLLFLLFFIALHTTLAQRFWVGNTGNWNNTANWSTTSGGVGGASVPTATDDVFFDAASNGVGTLPFTVTLDVPATCNTLNFTGTDAALTMDGANSLTVNGNVTTIANWTPTFSGAFVLAGATASATNTINFTGQSFAGGIEVNATAASVTWQATAGTITTTSGVLLRRGTLNTNGRPLSAVSISANDAGNQDRGLTLGASAVTLTGTGTVIDFTDNAATFTLSSGTSTATMNNASNTTVITGNSTKTMPNLDFSVVGGIATIQTSGVAANTITFGTISTAKATLNVTGTGAIVYNNTVTLPANVTANFGGGNVTFASALTLPNSAITTFNNTGTNTFNTTLTANAGAGSSLSFTNTGLNTFTGAVTLNSLTNTINNTGANAFAALNTGAGTATTFGTNVTNNTFSGAVAFGGTSASFTNGGTNTFNTTLTTSAGAGSSLSFTNTGLNTFTGVVTLNSLTNTINNTGANAFAALNTGAGTATTFGANVTNNTFSGAVALGGTSAIFNNTGTNNFAAAATIGVTTGTVAFSNNGNTYNGNITLAAGTTWRFSGTGTSTVAATANMILNGSCLAPPTNYVTVNSNTGTANVTFANAQTWSNAVVANLNVTGTVTVNQGYTDGGGNTNVTFAPLTTSRTLFWVGGTGNWNSEANWSLTSGGAGGQCIPTINDDVVFDAASGGAGFITTFNVAAICRSANFTGVNAMTLAGTNTWTVAGNLTLVANVTTSFTGKLIFDDNLAGTNTIVGAAKLIAGGIDFNSSVASPATASWQMATSGLGATGTGALALINGTLNTNGQPLIGTVLNANPAGDAQRALTLGASAIILTGTATVLDLRSAGNNLTLTSGTATVTMNNAAALVVETGNSTKTLPNLNFSTVGATATINISATAANTITFGTINSTKTNISVVGASSAAYLGAISLANNTTSTWGGNNATFTANLTLPDSNIATFSNTGTNTFSGTFTANAGAGSSLTFTNGGANTFTGNVTLNALTKNINNTGTNTFSGTFTAAGTTTVFGANVSNNTFTGAATLSSTTSVTHNNTGNNAFGNTLTVSSPTTSFNNTAGTNTFTGAVALNGANTNFSNATNNFSSTITVNTNNTLTFNNTTNNSFAGNITANANATLNFSTRAGTSNTFTGTATIVSNGNCSNPPTSFVKIKSPTAGTQVRLTFVTAHTWANASVQDINVVGGGAIVASAANADAGNNTGNISFTTSATSTGRNLFWVGGTGNWNDVARWSLTSGGAGGECVPTIFDNVNFDAASGSGYTVTLNTPNPICKSVNFTGANTMTLAGAASVTWTVGGNFNINNPNVTQTGIGATFLGTIVFTKSPNFPVAAQGEVLPATINMGSTATARQFANITFDDIAAGSSGGAWSLTSAMNTSDPAVAATTDGFLQLLGGTLNTNGQTVRCRTFSTLSASSRTLNISSIITVTGKDVDRPLTNTTIDLNSDVLLVLNPTAAGEFNMTNSQGGGGAITLETGNSTKTLPHLNYSGTFGNIIINSSNLVASTITINQITVANNLTSFSLTGNSQKVLTGATLFSGTITGASAWNGNTTFNAGATLTFANTVNAFTFNGTTTSSANITSSGAGSAFTFADTFTHNAGNTFAFGATNTLNFNGTVNNTYAIMNGTGAGHILNFNNTGNNSFNGAMTVGATSTVTFASTTDNNNFAANFTAGVSSTVRFSTNAGTSNTFAAGANFIPLGDCSNPPSSYVNIRSTTNGTAARLTFATAQVWNHVLVTDINNVLGQTVTVNAVNGDGGNNTNIIFAATTIGRTLYWSQRGGVAGSQNWFDPNSWSLSPSGLPVGECPPTINDIVIVNDNSYTVNGNTMVINGAATCRTMDWQITTAGRNPLITVSGTPSLRIAENFILPLPTVGADFSGLNATITLSATLPTAPTVAAIGVNRIIRSNGNTTLTNADLTINDTGVGVTWTLENDFTLGTNSTGGILTVTNGHLKTINAANTTAHTLNVRRLLSAGAGNRTLTFANAGGASTINLLEGTNSTTNILNLTGTNLTVNAVSGANISTINSTPTPTTALVGNNYIMTLDWSNTAALGNLNFSVGSTANKRYEVRTTAGAANTITFNNISVANLSEVVFTGTSTKTINNLTVGTPTTGLVGFVMNGNTTINGVVDFSATGVRTTFNNTATFITSNDIVNFGNDAVANFLDALTVTGRSMTFGTTVTASMSAMTFTSTASTSANLTFNNGASTWTVSGAAIFNNAAGQTANVVLGDNVTAFFCSPITCAANNVFRNFTVGTTCDITFGNTGTNSLQVITIGGGSAWRFSVGGLTSFTDMVLGSNCTSPIILASNLSGTCASIKVVANQSWNEVQVSDLNRDNSDGAFPGTITVVTQIMTGCGANIIAPAGLPRTFYWIGGTGNWGSGAKWSFSTGGSPTGCIPTINDDVIFDANSSVGAYTVVMNVDGQCRTMDWTGGLLGSTANNDNVNFQMDNELTVAGSLAFSANVTVTSTVTNADTRRIVFNPISGVVITARTIRMNGVLGVDFMDFRDFNAAVGTWTLQDNLTLRNVNLAVGNTQRGLINLLGGTLITNNFTVNVNAINANPLATYTYSSIFNAVLANPAQTDRTRRLELGSSQINIAANNADINAIAGITATACRPLDLRGNSTNFTINAGTSHIRFLRAGGTITVEMGTQAKTLYDYSQIGAGTTMTLNTSNTGPHIFHDCTFANNTNLTVAGTSVKTYNSLSFGNTTTSTFNGRSTVTLTTTYGTATTTTFTATAPFHTFNGAVTIGSTVANFATFNDSNFKSTFTCSAAGASLTRFNGDCLFEGAVTYNGVGSRMSLRENNTFLSTAPLAFTADNCILNNDGGTSANRNNVFGSTITFSAGTVGGQMVLAGGGDFRGAVSMLGNTNTFTIGADLNRANLFRAPVIIGGNTNAVNVASGIATPSFTCFLSTVTIGGAVGGPPTTLATIPNVTFAGRTFFRDDTSIGAGSPAIAAGTYNITFNGLMEWVAQPANAAGNDFNDVVNAFITSSGGTIPTFASTAGKVLSIGNDNRTQMLPASTAAGVNCTFRNVTFGQNCLFTVQNTGAGGAAGHTFDVLTLNQYDVVEFPAQRGTAPNVVDPTITINQQIITNVNCTAWVKIATVEANRRVRINYPAGAPANNWTNVIMQDLHIQNNGATAPLIVTCTDCQPTSNITTVGAGGTINFIGVLPSPARYFWVGRSMTSNNWTNPANWSNTDGGPAQTCVPSANDDVFFTNNSFTNAFNNWTNVNIDVSFVFCRSMTWIPTGGHPDYPGMGAVDVTVPRLSSNIAVPSPATIQVYGNLYLPQTAIANAFDGIFEFTGSGNGRVNTISSPGTAEFFGPVVFNSSDVWEITDRWDSNNNARGSITINYGVLRAFCNGSNFIFPTTGTCTPAIAGTNNAKNINLTGNFTINLPVDISLTQARFESGTGTGGVVTFDGLDNNQAMSVAGVTGCNNTYDCGGNANICALSPFNNLVISKRGAFPTVDINAYTITIKRDLTITNGQLRDNGNQIRGNTTGNLTLAANTALRLGSAMTATVFPTCYTSDKISLSSGVNGALAAQTLATTGAISTAADSTNNASIVEYLAGVNQLIRGRVTLPAAFDPVASPMTYGTLILSGGNGAAATKVYKDMLNALTVNGSLIVRTGSVLRDMGFQITGSSLLGTGNRIRIEGAGQLYLGTGVVASTSVTYQPILSANVTAAFQTPTATPNAVTAFPTYTPIGNIGTGNNKMDLNNSFTGTGTNSPSIDGVAPGGVTLNQSAYSTVAYAANANQNVLAGFTYGNLALTNASAPRIKTVVGATLGTTQLLLGGNLLIQPNHEFVDAGFQIIGNGNIDAARIGGAPSTRVTRIRMEANTTLRLGITRGAAADVNTWFPTYVEPAGASFALGTPIANRNNNRRSLDATSTVIYDAGIDTNTGTVTAQRIQRVDGGFTYGNLQISNRENPNGAKVLALKYLDADLGTPASNGIAGNLTIDPYNYFWDNGFQINRTAAGGVFTMNEQSAIRFGGAFSLLGGSEATGNIVTTFPTNFTNTNAGRNLHISSVQVYGATTNPSTQNVAGGTTDPAFGTPVGFNYGSLVITGGTGTTKQNASTSDSPFIAANLHIDDNTTYSDNGAQIFGNNTASTRTALPAVLDVAQTVDNGMRAMTVTMDANAVLNLGTDTRMTTFPLYYPAARMGIANLATTSTVVYRGGVTSATAGNVNIRQIVASGFSYGNLTLNNSGTLTNRTDKWVADANGNTITTAATASGAWTSNLFNGTPSTTIGTTTLAIGSEVIVKGDLTIGVGTRLYDDGTPINNNTMVTAGNILNLAAANAALTQVAAELYLGNAATATLFPRFNTVQLNPTAAVANKNLVVYNSNQPTTITGLEADMGAFSYNNLTLSSTVPVTKILNSAITVRGNLRIGGGTGVNATTAGAGSAGTEANTLDVSASNHNITLSGDWITEAAGKFNMRTNTVTFDGNVTQAGTPTSANCVAQRLVLRPTTMENRFNNVIFNNPFNSSFSTASSTAIRIATITGVANHIRLSGTATFTRGHVGGEATTFPHPIMKSGKTTLINSDITAIADTVNNRYLMLFEATATAVGTSGYTGLVGGNIYPSANSHVVGVVHKITTATQNFIFPVGNGVYFAPIGLTNPSASNTTFGALYIPLNPYGTIAAPVYPTGPPTEGSLVNLSHASSVEFWQLDRISGMSSAQVLLGWDTPRSGGVNIIADLRVAHWGQTVADKWNNRGNTGSLGTINQGVLTSGDVITSFSPFTLGSITRLNPLPVTLLNFNAKPRDKSSVEITWETIEERTNSFFTIERSLDGLNFAAIKVVPSKAVNGNSTGNLRYLELDTKPYKGVSYYRLRQTDIDGKTTNSRIVAVNFDGNGIDPAAEGFIVYPNPNDGTKLNIKFTDINFDRAEIGILDMIGREIYRTTITKNGDIFSMDFLSSLAAGQYVIRFVTDSGKVYNRAFVVE